MADSIKRRDFLKTASLPGASVAIGNTGSAKSLLLTENNIVRVHVRFEKSEQVPWEIKYDEFF